MSLQLNILIRGVGEVPIDVEAETLEDARVFLEKNGYINAKAVLKDVMGVFYKADIAAMIERPADKPPIVQARQQIIMPMQGNGRAQ